MDSTSVITTPLQRHLSLEDRLRAVVQQEFDLEIALKRKELCVIDDEIAKIENMLYYIKLYHEKADTDMAEKNRLSTSSPQMCFVETGVPEFAEFYAQFLIDPNRKPPPPPQPQPEHMQMRKRHYSFTNNSFNGVGCSSKHLRSQSFNNSAERPYRLRTRPEPSAAAVAAASSAPKCLVRRADNVLVKLVCPRCGRDNFGSPQGFINHCRISHGFELTTHDAAALECGVEVKDSERTGNDQQYEIQLKRRKTPKIREEKTSMRSPVTMPPPRNVKGKTLPGTTKNVTFGKFPRVSADASHMFIKEHRASFLGRIESSDEENNDESEDKEEETQGSLSKNESSYGDCNDSDSSSESVSDDDGEESESESESDSKPSPPQADHQLRRPQQQHLQQSQSSGVPVPRTTAVLNSSRQVSRTPQDRFSFKKKGDNLQKYLSLSRFF